MTSEPHPKLSICLLTYNQPDSVRHFFESLQKQDLREVEILIKDDSSNGDTESIVNFFRDKVEAKIRYYKDTKSSHGGYDKSLLFITHEATGQYIWWFGDDVFAENAISTVISATKSPLNYSFIWLNSKNIFTGGDIALDLGGDRTFTSINQIFPINMGLLGFPSATIVRRDLIGESIARSKKFIGTTLTGFYIVLSVLTSKNQNSFFIQEPLLLSKPKPSGEIRWYDSFQIHGINYALIAQEFKKSISKKSFRTAISTHFGRIWRAVVVERSLGLSTGFASRKIDYTSLVKLYWSYPELYICLPLFLLPNKALSALYKLYKANVN